MQTMRDIKRKINSVENTKKITRAMKLVAAAKLRKAQEGAEAAKPFFKKTRQALIDVTGRIEGDLHPLLEEREQVEKVGYIVITGDRGLCGPYNSRVLREVEEETNNEDNIGVIAIGKKGRNYFRRNGVEIVSEYLHLDDNPSVRRAKDIAEEIIDFYQENVFDKVYLIYTQFNTVLDHDVKSIQLLPVQPDDIEEEGLQSEYIYEPSPGKVLDAIIPKYIRNIMYSALLEAKASEFASRMTAMDSATENAEEIIDDLTLSFNRARQAEITQEISEIAAGAEALD
ncbi:MULTISPECIES: ATP synthase F1 subunit gamma [unclassified Candidatus Frackibacter]|jgi:F-type H+-transporting ATPase subunit gamma|uniref:ATP synthase F1 subunit gamma n=1 Tax=unclassified Candidatus Frackibacter TaxID=2648818 RepID=UPI0007937F8B|nr:MULTISPECIES: ATP synthase F1 subunit gamma [unclassified Candidatus Frackibacter]KXS45316.1 MAG: F-type H+-transporting ATPase subunit gamma [Candidatus Frackibacter sp. T328-2]SDC10330.1 ATP synthase F1 subcomplex gamma subunit [Candidatus Frackibacter sp. WG11]SEM37246.1 ATP synthase F1 subcomplex gamma subunit [Candidatus Frackibacter sp. WG12]SFL42645.1 ATP synthase F1 subcomplex gamma subunit [Candidatus Frackibacter sp. WG13]